MSKARPESLLLSGVFLVALSAGNAPAADVVWTRGVAASDHPLAAAAGVEILEAGGNAVDAAVAVSFALSVVRPYSCGIGGGGFLLVRLAADPRSPSGAPLDVAIDYRERAPRAVTPDYFERLGLAEASRYSAHAVATPGTVAGLLHALERYGSMDRPAVLAPAIRLAESGFPVDRHYAETAADVRAWFEADPARKTTHALLWRRFLGEGRIAAGDTLRNPEQARALRLIARDGADAFYRGPIAEAILDAVRAGGGILRRADLEAFAPREIAPLRGSFRGRTVLTMPPPSSGGVALLQMLGLLERMDRRTGTPLDDLEHNGAAYIHMIAECMKHAFADRALWMADPEFVPVPVDRLLSPGYLDTLAARIDPARTGDAAAYGSAPEFREAPGPGARDDGGTSHFCVIDAAGNAVSGTETINLFFGSRAAVEPFGFFLNDEMDDFTTERGAANAFELRQSDRNLPAPGKRPLSSMTPTIVLGADERVEAIAGGSGGPRIISGTLQVLLNEMVFDMGPSEALARARFHHQWWPDEIQLETRVEPFAVLGLNAAAPGATDLPGKGSVWMYGTAWDRLEPPWNDDDPLRVLLRELGARRGHALDAVAAVGVVQTIRRMPGGYAGAGDSRKGGAAFGR